MKQWNIENTPAPNALMLHAHPDDEIIFGGGLMLSNPGWNWTVVCITAQNELRLREFEAAMEGLRDVGVNVADQYALGLPDNGWPLSNTSFDAWLSAIQDLNLDPDIVFTHNPMGEYGHPHHMAANNAANTIYGEGGNVWSFVYPGRTAVGAQVVKPVLNNVELTPEILAVKNRIFVAAYGRGTQQGLMTGGLAELMDYEFRRGPELFTN